MELSYGICILEGGKYCILSIVYYLLVGGVVTVCMMCAIDTPSPSEAKVPPKTSLDDKQYIQVYLSGTVSMAIEVNENIIGIKCLRWHLPPVST